MSRYDHPSEPDLDRYESKPVDDIDVPDFDAPDDPTPVGRQSMSMGFQIAGGAGGAAPGTYAVVGGGPGYAAVTTDPPVDPAEHCVQAIVSALKDLEWITAANTDLSRAFVLRQLLHKAWMAVSRTDEAMIAGLDRIMERRR